MYKVIVRHEASVDALHAYIYYEEQRPGLGDVFFRELSERYSDLSEHPEYYSYVLNKEGLPFRKVKLKSFPYVVIYRIDGTKVVVVKVHNTHKKPRF